MQGAFPLKVKYIRTKKETDKNVNMEVNSNYMDSHRMEKTMYRSYPRQKLMSIMISFV